MDTETKLKARIIKEIWITGVDRTKLDCSNPVSESYKAHRSRLLTFRALQFNLELLGVKCGLKQHHLAYVMWEK